MVLILMLNPFKHLVWRALEKLYKSLRIVQAFVKLSFDFPEIFSFSLSLPKGLGGKSWFVLHSKL